MDYEKEYKAALERCREFYAKLGNKQLKEEVEDIFPELKESEDERIRKELIDFLEYYRLNNVLDSKTISILTDSVAWLEKQGEKKLAKNIVEAWKDMRLEVYQQASGNRHEPNYSDDTTKMFSLNDIDEIIEKMSEQKFIKWSDEDVNLLDEMYKFFDTHKIPSLKHDMNDYAKFIKSIKDRVYLQKQEWSKEDKSKIKGIINTLEGLYDNAASDTTKDLYRAKIDWLKSLRPQSQWRPSDEQMDALETAVSSLQSTALESLYNELKKL